MTRPRDWSALGLNHDPIPGDPQEIRAQAIKFREIAHDIGDTAIKLESIANSNDATGKFVEAFAVQAIDVASRIGKAQIRYRDFADALGSYAAPLDHVQAESLQPLTRAMNDHSVVSTADRLIHHYTNELQQPNLSAEDIQQYQRLIRQAQEDKAAAELDVARAYLHLVEIGVARDIAAHNAAQAIGTAGSASGLNDSGWDQWVQFWEDHGKFIDSVLNVLSYVGAILAVIACFVPGLNVLVWIIAAAIVLNALFQMSAGTKSVVQGVVEIAFAVIPFGAGKVFGKVAEKAGAGLLEEGADAAAKTTMSSMAGQGISDFTKTGVLEGIEQTLADGVPSVIAKFGSATAKDLAKFLALGDMTLVLSGPSERIGALVAGNAWKFAAGPAMEVMNQGLDLLGEHAASDYGVPALQNLNSVFDFSFKSEPSW